MPSRFLRVVVVGATVWLSSCSLAAVSPFEVTVLARAEEHAMSLWSSDDATIEHWDVSDFRVFGRDAQFGIVGAGSSTVSARVDAPDTYDVAIPFWYGGTTQDGDAIKGKSQLVVTLRGDASKSTWDVVNVAPAPSERLSFWRQFFAYIGWMTLGSIVLRLGALILSAMTGGGKWTLYLAALAQVPLAGYIASVLFGSGRAANILVGLAILGTMGIFSQIKSA